MHRYSLYGLTLESEIALAAPAAGRSATDLRIRTGAPREVPHEAAEGEMLCHIAADDWGTAHVRTSTGYSLRYFGTAEVILNPDLSEATAHADPRSADMLPELLGAGVPAFKLLLSGRAVMHASAVARDGRAVGFMAQSGGGKSTLAAALCAAGFAPVTDDVLALDWRGDVPHVLAGPAELRLREGSIARAAAQWQHERKTVDGRLAVSPGSHSSEMPPLSALVFPVLGEAHASLSLARLDADAALTAILGHLRVLGWKNTPVLQRIFAEQVRLAREVPAWRLVVPWGAAGLKQAVAQLQSLISGQS